MILGKFIIDAYGRMTSVSNGNGHSSYEYVHTGLQTAKTVNGERIDLINDSQNVIAEFTETENRYYYRGIQLIGYVSDDETVYY